MLALGTPAPDFQLPDPGGRRVALSDFRGAPALVVVFMCNHCPYVKHIRDGLAQLARDYASRGVKVVGINSNDAKHYPADSPARMAGFPPDHPKAVIQESPLLRTLRNQRNKGGS